MTVAEKERLISCNSHVHFTDDWLKARLSARLRDRKGEAGKKVERCEATLLHAGQPQLQAEDFVDRDGVYGNGQRVFGLGL